MMSPVKYNIVIAILKHIPCVRDSTDLLRKLPSAHNLMTTAF